MIKVDWGNYEESLVVLVFEDRWSLTDLRAAVTKTYALMNSKPHEVVAIVDVRRSLWCADWLFPKDPSIREGTTPEFGLHGHYQPHKYVV